MEKYVSSERTRKNLSGGAYLEFKVMVIQMIKELRKRIDEHSDNFHKEVENMGKHQLEVMS